MINTKKLRGKIIEHGLTYAKAADILGISGCTFGKKMRNEAQMTLDEAEILMRLLKIPKDEFMDYFYEGLEV